MVRNWMGRVGERAGSIQEGGMERGRGSVTTGACAGHGHARLTLAHPSADMSCKTGRESRITGASSALASRYGLVAMTSA